MERGCLAILEWMNIIILETSAYQSMLKGLCFMFALIIYHHFLRQVTLLSNKMSQIYNETSTTRT